ncbi:GrpB family protein [Actinocatenispora thailandica]|uniref:GrpB family protein n=1 Tax=Actinocatenispora thailandica TaxID=227318 RepID=UPI00194F7B4B|nr:GrpB family protein [Actinocatenispora thailandica]
MLFHLLDDAASRHVRVKRIARYPDGRRCGAAPAVARNPGCCWDEGHTVNLHVFGPDCDEHLRHLIFRDWLRGHLDDRDRYAAEKRRAAADNPWSVSAYNRQKAGSILDILRRAGLRPAPAGPRR